MAGIGFQLKKIVDHSDHYFHKVRAYVYSLLIIYGPMLVCMFIMACVEWLDKFLDLKESGLMEFMRLTGYIFVLSNVSTGVISLFLTRYVSDALYFKDYDKILPSLMGGCILGVVPGTLLFWGALWLLHYPMLFIISAGVFYTLISLVWILLIYLGALNNHVNILKAFLVGALLTLLLFMGIFYIPIPYRSIYCFFAFGIGFTMTAAHLYALILGYFGKGKGPIFHFLTTLKQYYSLIFINLFYLLGIYLEAYIHFVMGGNQRAGFMEAFYFASFVVLPGMVYFVVRFETSYFEKHLRFIETINHRGTYEDISLAKTLYFKTVHLEMGMLYRIVAIFTVIVMLSGMKLLSLSESSEELILRFLILSVGFAFLVLLYVVKVIFLYFDKREYAFLLMSVFLGLNLLFVVVMGNHLAYSGLGFLCSAAVSFLFGKILLRWFFKHIDYHLYR